MVFKAADAGAAGNNISITIANVAAESDPSETLFDVTVTETETYIGLTPSTIEGILGSDTVTPGTKPGLVKIVHASLNADNEKSVPGNATYNLAGGGSGSNANVSVTTGTKSNVTGAQLRIEAAKRSKAIEPGQRRH